MRASLAASVQLKVLLRISDEPLELQQVPSLGAVVVVAASLLLTFVVAITLIVAVFLIFSPLVVAVAILLFVCYHIPQKP